MNPANQTFDAVIAKAMLKNNEVVKNADLKNKEAILDWPWFLPGLFSPFQSLDEIWIPCLSFGLLS